MAEVERIKVPRKRTDGFLGKGAYSGSREVEEELLHPSDNEVYDIVWEGVYRGDDVVVKEFGSAKDEYKLLLTHVR